MPYHVQVRRSVRRAWAFNLTEERLRREILTPFRRGRAFELGDRWWEPSESDLRVLEGPELAVADLAHGQGWNAAERRGKDVTREILQEPATPVIGNGTVTVAAESPEIGEAAARVLRAAGFDVVSADAPPG